MQELITTADMHFRVQNAPKVVLVLFDIMVIRRRSMVTTAASKQGATFPEPIRIEVFLQALLCGFISRPVIRQAMT